MSRADKRPLRYRGVQLRSEKRRPLLRAWVSSLLAIYLIVDGVLVAIRSQRHLSTGAWTIIACITMVVAWIAVRSCREVRANRRKRLIQ